jgi:hypothetical protein
LPLRPGSALAHAADPATVRPAAAAPAEWSAVQGHAATAVAPLPFHPFLASHPPEGRRTTPVRTTFWRVGTFALATGRRPSRPIRSPFRAGSGGVPRRTSEPKFSITFDLSVTSVLRYGRPPDILRRSLKTRATKQCVVVISSKPPLPAAPRHLFSPLSPPIEASAKWSGQA